MVAAVIIANIIFISAAGDYNDANDLSDAKDKQAVIGLGGSMGLLGVAGFCMLATGLLTITGSQDCVGFLLGLIGFFAAIVLAIMYGLLAAVFSIITTWCDALTSETNCQHACSAVACCRASLAADGTAEGVHLAVDGLTFSTDTACKDGKAREFSDNQLCTEDGKASCSLQSDKKDYGWVYTPATTKNAWGETAGELHDLHCYPPATKARYDAACDALGTMSSMMWVCLIACIVAATASMSCANICRIRKGEDGDSDG